MLVDVKLTQTEQASWTASLSAFLQQISGRRQTLALLEPSYGSPVEPNKTTQIYLPLWDIRKELGFLCVLADKDKVLFAQQVL